MTQARGQFLVYYTVLRKLKKPDKDTKEFDLFHKLSLEGFGLPLILETRIVNLAHPNGYIQKCCLSNYASCRLHDILLIECPNV